MPKIAGNTGSMIGIWQVDTPHVACGRDDCDADHSGSIRIGATERHVHLVINSAGEVHGIPIPLSHAGAFINDLVEAFGSAQGMTEEQMRYYDDAAMSAAQMIFGSGEPVA